MAVDSVIDAGLRLYPIILIWMEDYRAKEPIVVLYSVTTVNL